MAKKRTVEPWMSGAEFGRTLPRGVGVNLLVREIDPQATFCRDALGAMVLYSDEDFAAIELAGSVFMLHADHAYEGHPMHGVVNGMDLRGQGVELRVYGVDPDKIEERARRLGYDVLSGSIDKPHGLRECHIIGPDGYVWVPGTAI